MMPCEMILSPHLSPFKRIYIVNNWERFNLKCEYFVIEL